MLYKGQGGRTSVGESHSSTVSRLMTVASRRLPSACRGIYMVHVYTSDVKNSGTDAGIMIEVLGDRATSGKQPLLDM